MYTVEEFFDENGYELKEILKSCIHRYYAIYKNENTQNLEQKIMPDSSIQDTLLSRKGYAHV